MAIDKAATCFGEMILGETITGLLLCVRCLSPLEAMTVGGFAPPNPLVRISCKAQAKLTLALDHAFAIHVHAFQPRH